MKKSFLVHTPWARPVMFLKFLAKGHPSYKIKGDSMRQIDLSGCAFVIPHKNKARLMAGIKRFEKLLKRLQHGGHK